MDTGQQKTRQSALKVQVLKSQLGAERQKMRQLEHEFNMDYRSVTNTVNIYAGGDAVRISRAGFRFFFPGRSPKRGRPNKITLLKAEAGKRSGMVVLRWKRTERLKACIVYTSANPNKPLGIITT